MRSLAAEFALLGKTIREGLEAPGEAALQNADFGLKEKELAYNIERQRAMDALAKENYDMQKQQADLQLPALQLAADKARQEAAMLSQPITDIDIVGGEDADMVAYNFYPDKDGDYNYKLKLDTAGWKKDDNPESPTFKKFINKDGSVVTRSQYAPYAEQFTWIDTANADPENFILMKQNRLNNDFQQGKITKEQYNSEVSKLKNSLAPEVMLNAYNKKLRWLSHPQYANTKVGQKAIAATEKKISDITAAIIKSQDRKNAFEDDMQKILYREQMEARFRAPKDAPDKEIKVNPFDKALFDKNLDRIEMLRNIEAGLGKNGEALETPPTQTEKMESQRLRETLEKQNAMFYNKYYGDGPIPLNESVVDKDKINALFGDNTKTKKPDFPAAKKKKAEVEQQPKNQTPIMPIGHLVGSDKNNYENTLFTRNPITLAIKRNREATRKVIKKQSESKRK